MQGRQGRKVMNTEGVTKPYELIREGIKRGKMVNRI